MSIVDQELARYLPEVIVGIVNSFFVAPDPNNTSYYYFFSVGLSGHPEHVLSDDTDWDYTLRGIIAGRHLALIPSLLGNMQLTRPRIYAGCVNAAFTAACAKGDREIMVMLVHAVLACGFCGGTAADHGL
jgi:hypothetical protein